MNNKFVAIEYKNHRLDINYWFRKVDGPVVLYLHGLGCSKRDFEGAWQYSGLKDYSLLAFDFPGSFDSRYPDDINLSVDDLVDITNLVVSSLQINKVILVGHSMGGAVGLLFAEKFLKKVSAFINVEGNLASEDCFFSRKAIGISFEEFMKQGWVKIKEMVGTNPSNGSKAYLEDLNHVNPRAYYDLCASLVNYSDNEKLLERFIKLPAPKRFIYGENNKGLSYLPILKNSVDVIEIPHSGHFPSYDNPEFFYETLTTLKHLHIWANKQGWAMWQN